MAKQQPDAGEQELYEIESPLAKWPGKVVLPHPDVFGGHHWDTWRNAVNNPPSDKLSLNELFAYAAIAMIEQHGEWQFESPTLAEFKAWRGEPRSPKVRVKFVSWLGRSMQDYQNAIVDPKN